MAKNKFHNIKPINNFALLGLLSLFELVVSYFTALSYEEFNFKVLIYLTVFLVFEWIYVI